MSSIVKHILRNTMEKKLRTVIVVLTILLATAVIFIGLSLNTIINDTYKTMIQGAYGNSNIVITKDVKEENPFYTSSDVDTKSIAVEQQNDIIEATGESRLDGENVNVALTGVDYDQALQMELIAPIKMENNFILDENSAIISQKAATEYGLSLGDSINVTVHDQVYQIHVSAISETNGMYYAELDRLLLVVAPDQVNQMYGAEDQFSRTLLTVKNVNLDQTVDQLMTANEDFSIQRSATVMSDDRDEETFQMTMVTAIIIIVLISAYVILSLSKMIVSERMPVAGTFRSIGMSKRTMNRVLGMEFLVYGIIGAILGLVTAFLILPSIADVFNKYKEFGLETEVSYSLVNAVIAFAFGMFFPVCVGMIHVVSMNKHPLKEIILNTTQAKQQKSGLSAIIGTILLVGAFVFYGINPMDQLLYSTLSVLCLLLSFILLVPTLLNLVAKGLSKLFSGSANGEMVLGIKNIGNNKMTANNSSMMIMVLILLMMVGTTTKGLDDYLSNAIKKDYDIGIHNLTEDPSFYMDVKQVDGVSDVRADYISAADYDIKGGTGQFGILGVEDFDDFDTHTSGITFEGDAKEQMTKYPDRILIDAYQAKRYRLDIGDTIQLQPFDAEGKSLNGKGDDLDIVIAGFIDSYGNGPARTTALVNLDYFNDQFGATHNQIGVQVLPGYDVEQVKKEISESFTDSNVMITTFDEKLAGQKATIDTLFQGITLIILMGMVIGLLGITNNLIVSFLQRKKEYAVLYSVCMSRVQLVKMQLYEMLITFIAVVVIGFIGGLLMNIVLEKLLYAIALRVELSFNFGLYGILCGVILVILTLSSFATVRKMIKMNMLKELRYE